MNKKLKSLACAGLISIAGSMALTGCSLVSSVEEKAIPDLANLKTQVAALEKNMNMSSQIIQQMAALLQQDTAAINTLTTRLSTPPPAPKAKAKPVAQKKRKR